MNSLRRNILVLATAMMLIGFPSPAQEAPAERPNSSPKSPVALFRELLAMTPQQRRDSIALRPEADKKRILEKLNEYELLPDELRDQRLRETELRWYLRPLMDEPQTNRPAELAKIPAELRDEVASRLQTWDLLPEEVQQQLKVNDLIASYFMSTPEQRQNILIQLSPERRDEFQAGLDRWQKMSEADHQRALASFNTYFELTAEQREKTLNTLTDEERQQMKQTLLSYKTLTPQQREQCISSFEKFASMSAAERKQFLINAERWREMTPEERQKWRQLVTVAPIMPQMNPPRQPTATNHSLLRDPSAVAAN